MESWAWLNKVSITDPAFVDRYLYTGREYDEVVDLYYYRARWYDPGTGRFVSQDPIGFQAGDANLYRYVGNNPVGWSDPYGLFSMRALLHRKIAVPVTGGIIGFLCGVGDVYFGNDSENATVSDYLLSGTFNGLLGVFGALIGVQYVINPAWQAPLANAAGLGIVLALVTSENDRQALVRLTCIVGEATASVKLSQGLDVPPGSRPPSKAPPGGELPEPEPPPRGELAEPEPPTPSGPRDPQGEFPEGPLAPNDELRPVAPKGARGPISGREFDPTQAGGPVRHLGTDRIRVTDRGIDVVEQHISRFGADQANQVMVDRLRRIARGELTPTQHDLNFYSHELREFVRYRRQGFRTGAGDDYDLWNNAHTGTLEDYRLPDFDADGNRTLYHPDAWPFFE